MIVSTRFEDLPAQETPMRALIAEPAGAGRYPGLVLYADIFGLTEATRRAAVRFAGYGFIVAVPDFYHRNPGNGAIAFAERERAFAAEQSTSSATADADARSVLDALRANPRVRQDALAVTGFCFGGHLAVRAALEPDVRATVAYYPTKLHTSALGSGAADTLERVRAGAIGGRVMLAFGSKDPHVPLDAITTIQQAFAASGSEYAIAMYDGEHAFMRDEGERWNPSEADRAYTDGIAYLRESLSGI